MIEFRLGSHHRGPASATQVVFQTDKTVLDQSELAKLAVALNGSVQGRDGVETRILREHCIAEVNDEALYVFDRTPGRTPNPHILCHRPIVETNRQTLHLLERIAEELYDMELCGDKDAQFFVH